MMDTDEYLALVAAIAEKQARLSTSSFFLTGEDAFHVSSFNSVAGVELSLEGRMIDPRGRTVPFAFRHVPNSDRTVATSVHLPGEGFLLGVQVRASAGAPRVGQCFVLLELGRGTTGAFVPLHTLIQGYATDIQRRAWPGSPIQSSLDGPGVLRSVAGADPAAGAEISVTVPTGARWLVHSLRATLTTDATVANREATLFYDDGATQYMRSPSKFTHTAGSARIYSWFHAATPGSNATEPSYASPIPFGPIAAGHRIGTSTINIQAGDNWSAPQLLVEEWIEG